MSYDERAEDFGSPLFFYFYFISTVFLLLCRLRAALFSFFGVYADKSVSRK